MGGTIADRSPPEMTNHFYQSLLFVECPVCACYGHRGRFSV